MSRCFPFPPPGYEKEARRGDDEELLKKEKHKEKKHKKEKREKEKREGKERKEKNRSKDKHKEKKDKKEKHKDKSKDKERSKDKGRTSEDAKTEARNEEVKDSRFTEELGRRIRDEEQGAATQSVGNFASTQRRPEAMFVSPTVEKENGNRIVSNLTGGVERRNENITRTVQKRTEGFSNQSAVSTEKVDFHSTVSGLQVANFAGQFRSRTDGAVTTKPLQKEKGASNTVSNSVQKESSASNILDNPLQEKGRSIIVKGHGDSFSVSGPKRTDGMLANSIQKEDASKPVNSFVGSVQKSPFVVNPMQKERNATNFVGAAQRKNGHMGQKAKSVSTSVQRCTESTGFTHNEGKISVHTNMLSNYDLGKTEKISQHEGNLVPSFERYAEGSGLAAKMVSNTIITEPKRNGLLGQAMESSLEKKERKEKSKDKKKEKGDKDRDRKEKKSKRKDKDRHKEEKTKEKSESKKHRGPDEPEDIRKKDQIHNIITKPVPSPAENEDATATDLNSKKRKESVINGFLHESDELPNKLPRQTVFPSHLAPENGKTLKLSNIAPPSFTRHDVINKPKTEIVLNNKESDVNGKNEANRTSTVLTPPVAVVSGASIKVSSKPSSRKPHPDAKYLDIVYSAPKMSEWPESDDQDWLFGSKNDSKPSRNLDDEEPPQVWARGMQIDSADVFALPYVVPF